MYTRSFRVWLVVLVATLFACASAPRSKAAGASASKDSTQLRSLDEARALSLIDELLVEARFEPRRGFSVDLKERRDFRVDLRVGEAAVGIEWVSEQDRARYGSLLPPPDPEGQLRVLSGDEANGHAALILVLDHESYRFHDDSHTRARVATADEREIERRLRRDLLEFIAYAKSQYLL